MLGGFVVGNDDKVAKVLAKSPGVIAGIAFANEVFVQTGVRAEWFRKDGDVVTEVEADGKLCIGNVYGPVRRLLLAERTALNIMSRASGIATMSRSVSSTAKEANWHGEVAATRKTTPGFSLVEKYAVVVGGASTHRMDLSHMVMLKDNHVWSVGNITAAVTRARSVAGFSSKIEVECRMLSEAIEAAEAGAEVIMLDNYTPEALKADAQQLKAKFPHLIVEASGGITEDTLSSFFSPYVDVVSMGKLTQGYSCLDFSMKIQQD